MKDPSSGPAAKKTRSGAARDEAKRVAGGSNALQNLVLLVAKLVFTDSGALADLSSTVHRACDVAVDCGFAVQNEMPGQDYNGQSQLLKQRQKDGEAVDFAARGPPFVAIFMQVFHWAATMMWTEKLAKISVQEVGSLVLHWHWKRSKAKQEGCARGRLIYAIDYTHEMGPALIALVEEMLRRFGAARRIGPAPRGPLGRGAAKLPAELSGQ
ncbi:unnamed protein product [Prorocentrum cordatum]|uniref:Uncharacterized protein n=1 Tax=Prorocentrum cordatum TaxID=2364126 RepID=A0ABN9PJ91_9DINO|nr:unnamed protein product [Polarella glacialis]